MRLLNTSLTRYEMTEDELRSGSILTTSQKAVIQNYICDECEKRLNLNLDPEKPKDFIQAEAEIKGAVGILKFLLDMSDRSEAEQFKLNLIASEITKDNKS